MVRATIFEVTHFCVSMKVPMGGSGVGSSTTTRLLVMFSCAIETTTVVLVTKRTARMLTSLHPCCKHTKGGTSLTSAPPRPTPSRPEPKDEPPFVIHHTSWSPSEDTESRLPRRLVCIYLVLLRSPRFGRLIFFPNSGKFLPNPHPPGASPTKRGVPCMRSTNNPTETFQQSFCSSFGFSLVPDLSSGRIHD